jgi:ADP-ribose pyrophosphatase
MPEAKSKVKRPLATKTGKAGSEMVKAEKAKTGKVSGKSKAAEKVSGKREPAKLKALKELPDRSGQNSTVLSSKLSYEGPLFKVFTEQVREPGGKESRRDIIRHNGSVVILAVDASKSRKDPLIIMEQQYRHAAGQYLVELPAGKLEAGAD